MKKPPNILFLFSDQHNAGVMGCAGHPDVQTPNLDRLAGEGVRFDRAYCQDGVCAPSRVSMMTGQYPRTTGVLYNPDQPTRPEGLRSLAQHLKTNGYRTAAFGKRHLKGPADAGLDYTCTTLPPKHEKSDETYWDWIKDQGAWEAFQRDWNAEFGYQTDINLCAEMASRISHLKPEQTMEAYTAEKTIDYLRDAKERDEPFFCWSSFYRPHQPYTPLQEYVDLYDLDALTLPGSLHEPAENLPPGLERMRKHERRPWCLGLAAKDINLYRRYIGYYYALVSEIDHQIGRIMATLEAEGLAENTIVLYTSDHGDFVGHHGMIEKIHNAHNVYEDTLRVPLIFRWPGHIREGATQDDLAELVDLYPTLLGLAGLDAPAGYDLPGRSLAPNLADGTPVGRDMAVSENWIMLTGIGPRHKLGAWIEEPSGGYGDMLFDRETDPLEMRNLAGSKEAAEAEEELREGLAAWIERTPNLSGKPLQPLG